MVIATVRLSTALTSRMFVSEAPLRKDLRARLMLSTAEAELSGVPSVNRMFGRSLTVHVLKSALWEMLWARKGWTLLFVSTAASGSKNVRARIWHAESHCMLAG